MPGHDKTMPLQKSQLSELEDICELKISIDYVNDIDMMKVDT